LFQISKCVMRAHLDIYVSMSFQWYKELFNPMGFYPCNRPLKIRWSIGTPTPKMGIHLGVWKFIPSHSFALLGTWNETLRFPSWPVTLQALILVLSPTLGLQHCISFSQTLILDYDVQFWTSHVTYMALHEQLYLPKLLQQDCCLF
jgi:hypothetical protein